MILYFLQEKDTTIETMQSELSKLRLDFNETQRSLTEKEKDLADATKTVQATRELKRELQYVKVGANNVVINTSSFNL